jgi:hypothetical protein
VGCPSPWHRVSLRRIAHYDYWSTRPPPRCFLDAKADLLVSAWASGPRGSLWRLAAGETVIQLTDIRGTAHVKKNWSRRAGPDKVCQHKKVVVLPSYEEVMTRPPSRACRRCSSTRRNLHNGRPTQRAKALHVDKCENG